MSTTTPCAFSQFEKDMPQSFTLFSKNHEHWKHFLFGTDEVAQRGWFKACRECVANPPKSVEDFPKLRGFLKTVPDLLHYAKAHIDWAQGEHWPSGSSPQTQRILQQVSDALFKPWPSDENTADATQSRAVAPGFLRLLAEEMTPPNGAAEQKDVCSISVPLIEKRVNEKTGVENIGVMAELRVRAIKPGSGGCYPAPVCSLLECDEDFTKSIENAVQALKKHELWSQAIDVCWTLLPAEKGSKAFQTIGGGSAGLGFAMAMGQLQAMHAHRGSRSDRGRHSTG